MAFAMTSFAPDPPAETAALYHGVEIPASPYLGETRIRRLNEGRYEQQEISGALAVVRKDDRVLELGAGIGAVGAAIARNCAPAALLAFEANPALLPHVRALYERNGLSDRCEVRNAVLTAGTDAPKSVRFHVAHSFLGSSLSGRAGGRSIEIEVETRDFDRVAAEFGATVLVMDIEGGEAELLGKIDLAPFRAAVIEFHPGVYGKEGMRACKNALRAAGLVRRPELSSRLVWTCDRGVRPAVPKRDAGENPNPDGGWSDAIRVLDGAMVVPAHDPKDIHFPAGVLDADGETVTEAQTWRNHRLVTRPPAAPDDPAGRLAGTWLWGGLLYGHFGHFLVESITRLWGLDHLPHSVEGIVFIPKFDADSAGLPRFLPGFLAALGCDLPVACLTAPTAVDRLIVPGQAFGLGRAITGTQNFRDTFARFGADVAPEGGEKLYISRGRIGPKRGGLLFEERLEEQLAAQGYEIFHPERHDIATQIARYKAARQVLAAEGSALHLYAFCGRPDARVGVVVRRMSKLTREIQRHIAAFSGAEVTLADAVGRSWGPEGKSRTHTTLAEIDFPRLHALLSEAGFVSGPAWHAIGEAEARAAVLADPWRAARGFRVKS